MIDRLKRKVAILLIAVCPFMTTSCTEESEDTWNEIVDIILQFLEMLGYDADSENVDDQNTLDEVEDVVTDSKVDWEKYYPPIGNQGSYGTCVAWATAYNTKTALNMIDGTWSVANKDNAKYQCSPIDLWHLIPTTGKSASCNGSNFEPAFETMISNGVSTMADVPFTGSEMTCDNVSGTGNSSNKLGQYRIVAYSSILSSDNSSYGMNLNNIKYYLKNGPLVIGAKLGDNFMTWDNDTPITYDTDTYTGDHAYHAMALVGYDDEKNAFRVRNSWGEDSWGDNGSIWVGYDFFFSDFCFGVWAASNTTVVSNASPRSSSSNDLSVKIVADKALNNGNREVEYSITNNGSATISTKDIDIVYLMFKAKHLAEKHILINDIKDINLTPGESATLKSTYTLPNEAKNGKYYLALIADPYKKIGDKNWDDNFSYVTNEKTEPLLYADGILSNVPQNLTEIHSLVSESNQNAYQNFEIQLSLIRMQEKR